MKLFKQNNNHPPQGIKIMQKYVVYINNNDPIEFDEYKTAKRYIINLRKGNELFNLAVHRVEIYQLM